MPPRMGIAERIGADRIGAEKCCGEAKFGLGAAKARGVLKPRGAMKRSGPRKPSGANRGELNRWGAMRSIDGVRAAPNRSAAGIWLRSMEGDPNRSTEGTRDVPCSMVGARVLPKRSAGGRAERPAGRCVVPKRCTEGTRVSVALCGMLTALPIADPGAP